MKYEPRLKYTHEKVEELAISTGKDDKRPLEKK